MCKEYIMYLLIYLYQKTLAFPMYFRKTFFKIPFWPFKLFEDVYYDDNVEDDFITNNFK